VKKKVLIIVENLPVPFDTRVWKEACTLQKAGYQVSVISPRSKRYPKFHEVLDGVYIYRHPAPEEKNSAIGYIWEYSCALFWEFFLALWVFMRRGFHVIQGCNPPDTIFLIALVFKLFGVRYIFDHHDASPELYLSKYEREDSLYKIQVWLEKMTFLSSDVVISTNESYRSLALDRGRRKSEDVFIVRNGPDLEKFRPVPAKTERKHGKKWLVGYVGTISIQEGLEILVDVAEHIHRSGRTDIHFTCVGGGPGLRSLCQLIETRKMGDYFNFTGRVSDEELLEVLSTADVCVNPDKPCEMNDISTMIKIAEYMALGKPIVQFDLKEGRFTAGEASLYADSQNQVRDFSEKILWLLDHPDERRRMGEYGRKRVQEELAWQYSEANLIAAYERAFEKRFGSEKHASTVTDSRPSFNLQAGAGREESAFESNVESCLSAYFKCPAEYGSTICATPLTPNKGFFRFGPDAILFGRLSGRTVAFAPHPEIHDAAQDVRIEDGVVRLPFDLAEVADNLYREAYAQEWRNGAVSIVSKPYYLIRPFLPVAARRHLQKLYLRGWDKLSFPRWPVDCSVDNMFESVLASVLRATGAGRIPFIWFWPDGQKGCALITHDVETAVGRDFCHTLMDIDDSFGIKASFQIIPEERYSVGADFLDAIRKREHELAIHDLNHDGHLYKSKEQFVERAGKINAYGREYKTEGFRAGVLYRRQVWYDELKFAYDMSVPNVAHLDPQRGGCCTVMPYFIGDILEIPVTTIQDYTLFNILGDYSTRIWRQQTAILSDRPGLMSFIIHPDYIIGNRECAVYKELLQHLVELRENKCIWVTTPSQVNRWWRQRREMKLVRGPRGWRIENPGDARARIAYASLNGNRLVYEIEQSTEPLKVVSERPHKGPSDYVDAVQFRAN
jgi:glycosyltransferase involved in cell wall biosynthesis